MHGLAVAIVVVAVGFVVPASASAACGASGPTAVAAWRGELIDRTEVSARPGGKATRWVSPEQVGALLVLGSRRDRDGRCWLRVRLPTRPNAATGWVDTGGVQVLATPWRIDVRLRSRTVTLLRAGARVARYRAVVGAPATPTPRGLFALVDAHRGDPSDFLGSWVLTLTAHSDVLQRYDGGDGRVALHGRGGASLRDPLGSAASHGCVRLSNAAIAGIVRRIGPAAISGTPVRVQA